MDISGVTVDFTEFGGGAAVVASNSSETWTATYTIISGNIDGTGLNVSVTATDNAGNQTTIIDDTNASVDNEYPTVTAGYINISGATGILGAYKVGDVVTATWDNTVATGDGNLDISGVTVDFTEFGGGAEVVASNSSETWTVTYTMLSGTIDDENNKNVIVTVTDNAGLKTITSDDTNATVDNKGPTASVSGTNTICADDSTRVYINLTGAVPWNITYEIDGISQPIVNTSDNPYTFYSAVEGTYAVTSLTDNGATPGTNFGSTATVTVNPLPVVSFTIGSIYNVADDPVTITTGNPYGGVFSGPGITASDSTFHPDIAGTQFSPHDIVYTYTDANGCTNSDTKIVTVVDADAYITGTDPVYCYDGPYDTITVRNLPVTATGRLFSITNGVGLLQLTDTTARINPSLIGPGTNQDTITYSYFDGAWFDLQKALTIDSVGTSIDFITLEPQYCDGDPLVSLTAVNLYPAGGTGDWSGPGTGFIYNNSNSTASLDPSVTPPGFTYDVEYQYTSPLGCKSSLISKQVTVDTLPILSFDLQSNYNKAGDPDTLFGNLLGGTFSGSGLVDSIFHPELLDPAAGIQITYEYTDGNGCANNVTNVTEVRVAGGSISNLNSTYCYKDTTFQITGDDEGLPGFGSFSSSNGGITDNGNNTADYSLKNAGSGIDTVTFTYFNDGTQYDIIQTVLIDSIGDVDFNTLASSYCVDAGTVLLIASFNHSSGSGAFSGPPGFTDLGNNTALLDPGSITPNAIPYDIGYTYTSTLWGSGCKSSIVKQTVINALPVVSFQLEDNYNVEGEADTLFGIPAGGTFSGPGMSDSIFYPNLAGVGTGYKITYVYTNPATGCTNDTIIETNVIEAQAQITGINTQNIYCYDGIIDTLVGETTNGLPGGTFTGDGITYLGVDSVLFNPAAAGSGNHPVSYEYTGTDGVTIFVIEEVLFVDSIGDIDFVGLEPEYCVDAASITLTAVAPQDGTGNFYGPPTGFFNGGNTALLSPGAVGDSTLPYDIQYVYISDNGICSRSITKQVLIHPLPVVFFSIRPKFNVEEPPINLIGSPLGGSFSGRGINTVDSTFLPSVAGILDDIDITYTYTDTNGCTNSHVEMVDVVDVNAVIEGLDASNIYCYDGPVDILIGNFLLGTAYNGYFDGPGITNTGVSDTALFNPALAGSGNHTITYYYWDSVGTPFNVLAQIKVDSIGPVTFFGYDPQYCSYENQVELYPSLSVDGVALFSGSGILGNFFYPTLADIGSNEITYTYVRTYSGCKSDTVGYIRVNAPPETRFEMADVCISGELDSTQFINLTNSNDPVATWKWTTDNFMFSTEETPKWLYTSSGLKNVILEAVTDQGCSDIFDAIFTLGDKSLAEFSWQNECYGDDPVTFLADTDEGKIISFRWDYGDGSVSTDTTQYEPTHLYNSTGSYDVSLFVETGFGCVDTIEQTVDIRPYIHFQEIQDNSYNQDFESGTFGWVEESTLLSNAGSWELGIPSGDIINTSASGVRSWYTDINKDEVEQSWISGPCFDFSELKKPMIKMNIWSAPEKGRNGAVLQSSVDEGKTWINVGTLDDGINWYNSFAINGAPGGQAQGWSGEPDTAWVEARHSLDELVGEENVRFRIAFGADGGALNDYDGFAFDDIWIGERSRIVLLEHFTNATDNASDIANGIINPVVNNHLLDAVDIQYHTSYPQSDPMNLDNPSDPSARTLYYGIPGVPYTIIDGNITNPYNYTNSILKEDSLKLRSLVDPDFNITLDIEVTGNTMNISTGISAISSIPAKDITVQIAVIEKEITLAGNTVVYKSVLKKLLPDAGGTNFSHEWVSGETENISVSWEMNNIYDNEQVKVVVFVQDETTKEILQATTDDFSVQTGIYPMDNDNMEFSLKLYPNPSSGKAYLLFSKPLQEDCSLKIFNNIGALIESKVLRNGVQFDILDTENYQNGMYIIRIMKDNKTIGIKQLSVIH